MIWVKLSRYLLQTSITTICESISDVGVVETLSAGTSLVGIGSLMLGIGLRYGKMKLDDFKNTVNDRVN